LDYVETAEIQSEQRHCQAASALNHGEPSMSRSRTRFATVEPRPPTPRLALSIPEFCEAHGISEGFFYKLKKQGEGPREMKVGARTLITFESAAEWRRTRENQRGRGLPGLPDP
jgi:predicted DNA-binding transcriptional regulator AlpA